MPNFRNDDPITDGQIIALTRLLSTFESDKKARLYMVSHLVGRNVPTFKHLTIGDWRAIRDDAYPFWRQDDWKTIGENFARNARFLSNRYREDVTGQLRLF